MLAHRQWSIKVCGPYLGSCTDSRKTPKLILAASEELKQRDDETPRVRAMNHKPLNQNARNLLANLDLVAMVAGAVENVQNEIVIVESMAAWVAKMIGSSTQEKVAS